MKRLIKGAMRGIKAELAAGTSGWIPVSGGQAWPVGGHSSVAGKTVNFDTSLSISAVWACVTRTAELVATLPLALYEKQGNGNRVAIDHDLVHILTVAPNSIQTGVEFWEGMVAHSILRGNGCAQKLTLGRNVVGYKPLPGLTPTLDRNGSVKYSFYDRGKLQDLPPDQVLHLRGFDAGNGLGLSAIKYGANSLGAALAADETAGAVFSNRMMAAGVLESAQELNEKQRGQLQDLLSSFVGSSKAGKTLVLEAGLKWNQVQMNPEDAQLLETRRFQVEDVCRWFGVPPIVIGHSADGQTMWGSGIEQILLSWLTLGINPLLKRIEGRMNRDVVPIEKRGRWYFEFNREAMLQMDSKAKGEFMAKMGMSGTMTANERREKLNLPRHDDPAADALLAQTALAPLEDLGKDQK